MNFENNRFPRRPLELLSIQEREELSQPGNDDPNKEVSTQDLLPIIDISEGITNRVKKIQAGQLMARLAEGTFADVDLSNINQEEAISNLGRLDDALVSMDGE